MSLNFSKVTFGRPFVITSANMSYNSVQVHLLPDEVMRDINVLGAVVKLRVSTEFNRTAIILVDN